MHIIQHVCDRNSQQIIEGVRDTLFSQVGISEHGTSSMKYLDSFTLRPLCNALRMDEDNSQDNRARRETVLQASYEMANMSRT